jgi:hypothetical protein
MGESSFNYLIFSLSSRQSASRSFETVIRVPDSDSLDTEEEIRKIRRAEKSDQQKRIRAEADATARAKSVPKDVEAESREAWMMSQTNKVFDQELLARQVVKLHALIS